jgi:hypothetical protein
MTVPLVPSDTGRREFAYRIAESLICLNKVAENFTTAIVGRLDELDERMKRVKFRVDRANKWIDKTTGSKKATRVRKPPVIQLYGQFFFFLSQKRFEGYVFLANWPLRPSSSRRRPETSQKRLKNSKTIDYRCDDVVCPRLSSSDPNLSKPMSRTANSDFYNYKMNNCFMKMSSCLRSCIRRRLIHLNWNLFLNCRFIYQSWILIS